MTYATNNSFVEIFQDFEAFKLCFPRTLWIDDAFEFDGNGIEEHDRARRFADKFAYMIPGGEYFRDLKFDKSDSKTLRAERYGGYGVGENGGGVRCGNIDRNQVKGIGQNLLVGIGSDQLHSYGGLSAVDAIYETIYAHVLNKIMPIGVVPIRGIILTGEGAAYIPGVPPEPTWGALMVRDTALRPAHFLRAGNYRPRTEPGANILSDVARVRMLNKRLLKRVGSADKLARFLKRFLTNCANQFAFARVARTYHGSVSPSNMCFDGRWIDLTVTQFLPSTQNTAGYSPDIAAFYEEYLVPVLMFRELADTLVKYNGVELDIEALISNYFRAADVFFKHHLGYLFGFANPIPAELIKSAELEVVKAGISKFLSSAKPVLRKWPSVLQEDDPLVLLIETLCPAIADPARYAGHFTDRIFQGIVDQQGFLAAHKVIVDCMLKAETDDCSPASRRAFIASSFIVAFKRAVLPEYFFKGRLENCIVLQLKNDNLQDVTDLINSSIDLGSWIFGKNAERSVLYRSESMLITFDEEHSRCVITGPSVQGGQKSLSIHETQEFISSQDRAIFVVNNFDFTRYLKRLLSTLACIIESRNSV